MQDVSGPTVFVIDDDVDVRNSLQRSLSVRHYTVEAYDSGQSFLGAVSRDRQGCIVLDISMPGMNGLDLQDELNAAGYTLPIIFVTGHGDVAMTVRAMKGGAAEFIEKPYGLDVLIGALEKALTRNAEWHRQHAQQSAVRARYETLTAREREVMACIVTDLVANSSKDIARTLGISHRTVHEHRARVMSKMQARSVAQLVELSKHCVEPD